MASSSKASKAAAAREGDPKGLYSLLGVSCDVDEGELRKAYRRLALRWHPDKNPDDPSATETFQKISAAYEVLSDKSRREMYDSTGCVDADEMEDADLSHATDLFAAFFGGFGGFGPGGFDDLDAEEQGLIDELLRMSSGGAFKRGRRSRKKQGGKGGRRTNEFDLLFQEMMGAGEIKVRCPAGNVLKRKKADGEYTCDGCGKDIGAGKRIYDCRKSDYCLCVQCHKAEQEKQQTQMDEDLEEADAEELVQAFIEATIKPVREGGRLRFKCELDNKKFNTEDAAVKHVLENHTEELQAFIDRADMAGMGGMPSMFGMPGMGMPGMPGMPGFPAGMGGMPGMREEDLAAMFMMEGLLGGEEPRASSSRSSGRPKPRKKR